MRIAVSKSTCALDGSRENRLGRGIVPARLLLQDGRRDRQHSRNGRTRGRAARYAVLRVVPGLLRVGVSVDPGPGAREQVVAIARQPVDEAHPSAFAGATRRPRSGRGVHAAVRSGAQSSRRRRRPATAPASPRGNRSRSTGRRCTAVRGTTTRARVRRRALPLMAATTGLPSFSIRRRHAFIASARGRTSRHPRVEPRSGRAGRHPQRRLACRGEDDAADAPAPFQPNDTCVKVGLECGIHRIDRLVRGIEKQCSTPWASFS